MSDAIILSNESSALLATISDKVQDLSYSFESSFPNLAPDYFKVQTDNVIAGAPAGQEITFTIPRFGLIRDMLIQCNLTCATTNATGAFGAVGFGLFERIEIRSANNTLFTIYDASNLVEATTRGSDTSLAVWRRALCLNQTTGDPGATTSVKTFVPVFNSFFESVVNHLDLHFHEKLQVVCRFNSAARMGVSDPWLTASSYLHVLNYRLNNVSYDLLRQKNLTRGQTLTYLTYNHILEKQTLTSQTENTMRLTTRQPIFRTAVFLRDNAAAGEGALKRINALSFRIAGKPLYESADPLVLKYINEKKCGAVLTLSSATAVARLDDFIIPIDWSLLPQTRTRNTGMFSFAESNNPEIVIETDTSQVNPASRVDMFANHTFWQLINSDTTNGLLSRISSA